VRPAGVADMQDRHDRMMGKPERQALLKVAVKPK